MQCPKCQQPLTGIDYQGVHIETCPDCGGDWLDAGQLGNIVRARAGQALPKRNASPSHRRPRSPAPSSPRSDRHPDLPQCGGTTHPVNYGDDTGLIIDECAGCNGVWLDKGELDKIEELCRSDGTMSCPTIWPTTARKSGMSNPM